MYNAQKKEFRAIDPCKTQRKNVHVVQLRGMVTAYKSPDIASAN